MNAPVVLAQLNGVTPQTSSGSIKDLKVAKPQNGQAVTVHLDGGTKIDFRDISSEKLTFVRIGDRLIILFDNQSTVSIDPVFNNDGAPLPGLSFEMGPERILDGNQFAELFPITTDQSVLPAAGTPGAPGVPAGANFGGFTIDALTGGTPLALLGAEDIGGGFAGGALTTTSTPIPGTPDATILNEDGLSEGNLGGPGDTGGVLTSFTGSLNIDFGSDFADRSLAFNAAQPGLVGLTSGGEAVSIAIAVIGGVPTLIGYVGADPSVAANQVFVVTLDAATTVAGSYTVTLLRPLDHSVSGTEDTLSLTIGVIATDGSGDTAPVSIVININDDSPEVSSVGAVGLAEQTGLDDVENVFVETSRTVSLGIAWGADSGNSDVDGGSTGIAVDGDRSLVFDPATITALEALALTSNGETISYALSADGTEIVASAGGGESARTVFTVTLSDQGAGSYTFVLSDNLDHVGADDASQPLNFTVVATDADGDSITTNFEIDVADDVLTIGTPESAAVDEDDLPAGNRDVVETDDEPDTNSDIDTDGSVLTSAGSLAIDWNSDDANSNVDGGYSGTQVLGDRSVSFADQDAPETLTSAGQAVRYAIFANGTVLVAYTGESAPEGFDPSQPGSNVVFFVTLSDQGNGSYTFHLLRQLDHSPASETPDDQSEQPEAALAAVAVEDNRDLTFNFIARDGDGDVATGSFTVSVDDDSPVTNGAVTAPIALDDDEFGGNLGGAGDVTDATSVSGAAGALFTVGADGMKSVVLDSSTAFDAIYVDADGVARQETVTVGAPVVNGSATTWTFSSDSIAKVATLTINADGSYSFTTFAPVVHPTAGTTEENLGLSFAYTVTDGDGDTATGSLTVDVNDDTPVSTGDVAPSTILDDEAQLEFTPANDGIGLVGDVSPNVKVVTGVAGSLFVPGADGFGSVAVTPPSFAVVYQDAQGFAQTESVQWNGGVTAGGTTTWTATSPNYPGGAAVLVINADGSYSFTLNAPLAHGLALPLVEENATLTFGFTVTDGDGDQASGSLAIRVNDDTPTANLVVVPSTVLDDEAQTTFVPGNAGPGGFLGGDVSPDVNTVSGGAGALFSMGSDGLTSIALDLPSFAVVAKDADGFAQGEPVTWGPGVRSADGTTTWTAISASYPDGAATLVIRADGSYSFTMHAPLAHGDGLLAENTDTLGIGFTVTDGDGDQAGGLLMVRINDDRPVASNVTPSTLLDDEAQSLFTPANVGGNGDVDPDVNTVSGGAGALFSMGSDGLRSIALNPPGFAVIYKDGNGFAGSESVQWSAGVRSADGTTTYTATSTHYGSGTPAAVLAIKADGSYSFTLNAPVAHSNNSTTEENATLEFRYTVTDGDGDTASARLRISVDDDGPVSAGSVTASTTLDDDGFGGNPRHRRRHRRHHGVGRGGCAVPDGLGRTEVDRADAAGVQGDLCRRQRCGAPGERELERGHARHRRRHHLDGDQHALHRRDAGRDADDQRRRLLQLHDVCARGASDRGDDGGESRAELRLHRDGRRRRHRDRVADGRRQRRHAGVDGRRGAIDDSRRRSAA
ncbi:T1SS-143 domain-containing protein [Rhodopseudomonas thermotolerans]|uniref:T1SS-143 domain-containing protein n=1 Tax=Rhodopseudomonas thermotolerans TaxID=999700 RepID=A0ABX9JIK9_9BRAD|nr:hypothetical protein [Rhodopseudomonas thermotolerans]REG07399.1 T1SS-143 domain-containing protein [Rhodopseudomonas thermotolerans]